MKNFLFSLCLIIGGFLMAQISTSRMGDLKINQSLTEIEKVLGQKINLIQDENQWSSNAKIDHNGIEFELVFIKPYSENEADPTPQLYSISTSSTKIKTISKLGIGSKLDELFTAYKNYDISIWRLWDQEKETYSKTERVFQLLDNELGTVIYFYMRHDVVYKIELMLYDGC